MKVRHIMLAPFMLIIMTLPAIMRAIPIGTFFIYPEAIRLQTMLLWPLIVLTAPYYIYSMGKNQHDSIAVSLSWAMVFAYSLFITSTSVMPGLELVLFSAWFANLYILGANWFNDDKSVKSLPFLMVGFWGTALLSFMMTLRWTWLKAHNSYEGPENYGLLGFNLMTDGFVLMPLMTCLGLLAIISVSRNKCRLILWSAGPVLAIPGFISSVNSPHGSTMPEIMISMILFNLYLAILGIERIVSGVWKKQLSSLHAGLVLLGLSIAACFRNFHLGLVEQGIGFILVGAVFLVVHYGASRWIAISKEPIVTEGETA